MMTRDKFTVRRARRPREYPKLCVRCVFYSRLLFYLQVYIKKSLPLNLKIKCGAETLRFIVYIPRGLENHGLLMARTTDQLKNCGFSRYGNGFTRIVTVHGKRISNIADFLWHGFTAVSTSVALIREKPWF